MLARLAGPTQTDLPWAREVPFQTVNSVSCFFSLSNNLGNLLLARQPVVSDTGGQRCWIASDRVERVGEEFDRRVVALANRRAAPARHSQHCAYLPATPLELQHRRPQK